MGLRRRQYFVDRAVQGGLVSRTIAQWFFCLVSIAIILLCWRVATHPSEPFASHFTTLANQVGPAFLGALFLLPLVVIDVVKMSNRFVGTTRRLQGAIRRLAAGEEVAPLRVRDNDLWPELAKDFNALLARVNQAEKQLSAQAEVNAERSADAESELTEEVSATTDEERLLVEASAEEALSMAISLTEEVS